MSTRAAVVYIAITAIVTSSMLNGATSFLAPSPARDLRIPKEYGPGHPTYLTGPSSGDSRMTRRPCRSFNMQPYEEAPISSSRSRLRSLTSCGNNDNDDDFFLKDDDTDVNHQGYFREAMGKFLLSAGVPLAWYFASSTMVLAIEVATGAPLPFAVRRQRRFSLFAPVIYLYVFSNSTIKKRNKFEGVIPKDMESRKILAKDAFGQVMSCGRPAARVSYVALDIFIFSLPFLNSVGRIAARVGVASAVASLGKISFWMGRGAWAALYSALLLQVTRKMGYGYVRSCLAGAVAPIVLEGVIKPAKTVASVFGFGSRWDLGKDASERHKIRQASRQLRENLSTFVDPVHELIEPLREPSNNNQDGSLVEEINQGDDLLSEPEDRSRS